MNRKLPICVVIAVRNEERNIAKCLASLLPAMEVFVVDSGSIDNTCKISESSGAQAVVFNGKLGYPKKRQWFLEQKLTEQPWIFFVDADEEVPDSLWTEISKAIEPEQTDAGFLIQKGFWFLGKEMKYGGFSHSAVLLIRNGKARFENLNDRVDTGLDMEVHERLIVDGPVGTLKTPLIHNDFKGLDAYIDKHNRYSRWEAAVRLSYLSGKSWGGESIKPKLFGNSQERRRFLKQLAVRIPFEPWAWFIYHYFLRLGFLEGRRGLIASQIRAQYIANVRAKMFEERLRQNNFSTPPKNESPPEKPGKTG